MADLPASDTTSSDTEDTTETLDISELDTIEIDLTDPEAMEAATPVDVDHEVVE